MSEPNNYSTPTPSEAAQTPTPSDAVQALDRLAGPWTLSGDSASTVTYRWLPGRHFLAQDVDIVVFGHASVGLEVIGHVHPFEGEREEEVRSRFYGDDGHTLDYVYDFDGDTLTIWGGEAGSPAYFRGTFDPTGTSLAGGWVWPGGGYSSTMTREKVSS